MRSTAHRRLAGLMVLIAGLGTSAAGAEFKANGLVILCTDYGADSIYVGALKGAMYAKFPAARIDSLTNSIPPYDIITGAYLAAEGAVTFPAGTTFCCVVDPGVGTKRRCIALETKTGLRFVAPDNGLLTLVADKYGVAEVRECANSGLWRGPDVSTTFHGRDIMGPVAAALANGAPMSEVGPPVNDMVRLEIPTSRVVEGLIEGAVIRVDDYGNVVTNISRADLDAAGITMGDSIEVSIRDEKFHAPLATTYSGVPDGQRVAVVQSAGNVELAINMGDLVEATRAKPKDMVTLRKAP